MIPPLLAWLLVCAVLIAAYPWARWLLAHTPDEENPLLAWTLTPGIGLGVLTLLMFWQGEAGLPYTLAGIALPYFGVMGVGYWVTRRGFGEKDGGDAAGGARDGGRGMRDAGYGRRVWLIAPVILVGGAILFNAVYWPFSRADALGIYQPFAHLMYETRALVPLTGADSLYRAYPMHVPLAYVFAYVASGWENEYLARLLSTLLGVACLPTTYLIGRRFCASAIGGLLAALLLAFSPFFVRWASSGYVDLPMAYYYALTALFLMRHAERGARLDALLAGLCLGLAAWTKNAALVGVPLLIGWWLWAWLRGRITLSHAALSLLACAAVAAPWYVRNILGAGFFIPDTAWVDQAQPSAANLIVYALEWENFGAAGIIITVGILGSGFWVLGFGFKAQTAETKDSDTRYSVLGTRNSSVVRRYPPLLLWWTLPFFGVWWLFASYDPRFLLLILPPLCTFGAALLVRVGWWLTEQTKTTSPHLRTALRLMLAALVLFVTLQAMWSAVEFKYELLRDPLMDHTAKIAIVRGGE